MAGLLTLGNWSMSQERVALGIDIGGTNTKMAIVNDHGQPLYQTSFPTRSDIPFKEYADEVYEQARKLNPDIKLHGVGVGAPNANSAIGEIVKPVNLGWKSAPLVKEFKARFKTDIFLENDANVAALGEKVWGLGQNSDHFIVVTLGTGIGTGIISHGQLISGPTGLAGEGGHITIYPDGRSCNCGGFGHLEAYASVRGLKLHVQNQTGDDLKFSEISSEFKKGTAGIVKAVEFAARDLGLGLAQMQTLFNPDLFILAGGVSTLGESFRARVEHGLNAFTYEPLKHSSKVVLSEIATEHGAVTGAASLVFWKKPLL